MEQAEENEGDGRGSKESLSPNKDDSLTDFKSPKLEPAAPIKARIIIDKRPKKLSSKGKTSSKKKKETVPKEVAQPSIESSFFKAAAYGKKDGHTCPLCMKYFADASTGTSHTKSCATKNKVSTKKLLVAVALQERQANERVAIGLPAGPIVHPKEKTPRRPREAGAKGDPDLQLALALSKSLQENQLEQEFEEALLLASEHRGNGQIVGFSSDSEKRKTLTNFGFLTNKPAGALEGAVRNRRKKHLGPTLLQTRSQEARDRLLTDRVAEILMGNEAITQVCRQESIVEVGPVKERQVILRSRLLREIHRTTNRVWDIAQLSTKITDFYVEDLAPVIVPADSQTQENSKDLAKERGNGEENVKNKVEVRPAIFEKSPLEEDDKQIEKMLESSEKYKEVNERAIDRLKIPSPNNINITDRQYRNTLSMDWTNTLNVSSMSDVVVLVENGHIWAHKLVFYVRCSNILLDCDTNSDTKFSHVKEKISWPDVDLHAGLAFLEFVYSGLIEKNVNVFSNNSVAIGVRRLARKYKVKALFDYLRTTQAYFDKINNISEEVKSRKLGLCSPVVIEVHKAPNDVGTFEENLPKEAEHNDAEEIEGRKSGLCSPIVIELEGTPSDVETAKENLSANGESKIANEDRESSQSSLIRGIEEFSSGETNILMQKIADNNLDSRNNDTISIISITSSRSRVSMSPDLFDETMEEAPVNSIKNSEEVEDNTDLSDSENSKLEVLADLIAQNDFSSSSEASRKSAATVISQDKLVEKSRSLDETGKSSFLMQHIQTPKSRSNSALELGAKIKDRSRSQLFPEKKKSNLSLFIAKIQKMNAKGPLESYTEEESLAEPHVRIRRRNPFNVNNTTDNSMMDSTEKKRSELNRGKDRKRGLSIFDEPIEPINPKDVNPEEETTADDTVELNGNVQTQKSFLADDTLNTDEEDISMYSKYRKTHMHNNSISNYRNRMKKLTNTTMPAENDDESDNSMWPDAKTIDLTQESDSDVDTAQSRISGSSTLDKQKIAGDTSDNDSIHSAATAIAHYDNPHNLSDDEDSKDTEMEKSTSIASFDKKINNDGKVRGKHFGQMSNTCSEPSSESEDAQTVFRPREKTTVATSSEDLKKKEQNIPKYPIDISPESVKNCRNSPRGSNHDLLEIDDEMFARSWKSKTPSPSPSFHARRDDILSPQCKKKTKTDKTKNLKSIDDLNENEQNVPKYSIDISPESVKSSRNSPRYSNHNLLEDDDEIFAQCWKSKSPSPSRIFTENKRKTEDTTSVHDSNKNNHNVPKYSIDISPENVQSPKNSYQNSNHDLLEGDTELFARSWKSTTPSPSKSSVNLPDEILSGSRKETTKKGTTMNVLSVVDSSKNKPNVPKCSINNSPESIESSKNSPRYTNHDLLEGYDEIFARSWKSRTPSPLSNSSASSAKIIFSRRKRKSEEIGITHGSLHKNLDEETAQSRTTSKSSKGTQSPRNSPEYSDLDVYEIDEEMFGQSSKKARILQQSPSQKRSFHYSDNSASSRRNRRAEEKKAKEKNFMEDLRQKNLTNPANYPDTDGDDIMTQCLNNAIKKFRRSRTPPKNQTSESLEKSASSRGRIRSNGERTKTPEICTNDFRNNESNKSLKTPNSLRNLSDYHYEVFEPDDHVFTQSSYLSRQSPCRTLNPLPNCASTSKNNDHCSTLTAPSPILITSSPEFDIDAEINFSNHESDPIINDKENLFASDQKSPHSRRKSYENLAKVISPTNFENSFRFSGNDFEKAVERTSTSNLERPTSPQPSTSWKLSSNRKEFASSTKNPLMRWNSMPTSSSKTQVSKKRPRTPTESSRFIMSQDVTPPVNYDMMSTPELKQELSKYGIKPQTRTRARKLLTHIYNELHPLIPASPETNKLSDHIALSDEDELPVKKIGKPCSQTSEDSDSDRELPLSQQSVTHAANVIPEEMDLADGNKSSNDHDKVTSTSSIKKAFKALLNEDKEMHNKVLTYEPLPLELLYLMLKSLGLKCKLNDLMDFLDEECITFQVQSQRNNNRKRRQNTARGRRPNASPQKS